MNAFSDKHVHVQHRFETNVFGEAVKGNPIMTVAVNARVLCCERRFLDPKRPRDPANPEHMWRPGTPKEEESVWCARAASVLRAAARFGEVLES